MAAILKHWREAATLIVVAKVGQKVGQIRPSPSTVLLGKNWQGKTVTVENSSFDYKVLMLKRSGKSGFMPSALVFPGGVADDADFSPAWLDLFSSAGCDIIKYHREKSESQIGPPSPMFSRQRHEEYSTLPADIAFRICAIRETFEESGLLLVTNANKLKSGTNQSTCSVSELPEEHLNLWRQKVDKNALEFLKLCKEFHCVPDIWALHEWSNWLTPLFELGTDKKRPRRYDTAFFMCMVDELPKSIQEDEREMVHFELSTPIDVLESFYAKRQWIAPPQCYELSRLLNFTNADDVTAFIEGRSRYRMHRCMPVGFGCPEGLVHTLVGDSMYPANPNMTGDADSIETIEEDMESNRKSQVKVNRGELRGRYDNRIQCNFDMTPQHVSPICDVKIIESSRL